MLASLLSQENNAAVQSYTEELSHYVFGCMVPMLNQLLTVHFPKLSWGPVQRVFSNALQVSISVDHCRLCTDYCIMKGKLLGFYSKSQVAPEHVEEVEDLLLALGVDVDKIIGQYEEPEEEEPPPEVRAWC